MTPLRVFSYGGGVQSTAALVLAAQGRIDFPVFVHANVGHDSENPGTVDYIRDVATPYAAEHSIELVVRDRIKRDGTAETLYGRMMRKGSRSLPIPVRMSSGAPARRSCTVDFKIRVLGKFLRERGATADAPATVGIGISLDEIQRANASRGEPYERLVYPLIFDMNPPLRRSDCERVIRDGGMPVPPKSACWFCPWHSPATWAELRRNAPELFERSADLEAILSARRTVRQGPVFLTDALIPLRNAISDDPQLFDTDSDSACDSGVCFT